MLSISTISPYYGKAVWHTNSHEQDLLLYRYSACCSLSRWRKQHGWTLHGTLYQQTSQQQSGAATRQQWEMSKHRQWKWQQTYSYSEVNPFTSDWFNNWMIIAALVSWERESSWVGYWSLEIIRNKEAQLEIMSWIPSSTHKYFCSKLETIKCVFCQEYFRSTSSGSYKQGNHWWFHIYTRMPVVLVFTNITTFTLKSVLVWAIWFSHPSSDLIMCLFLFSQIHIAQINTFKKTDSFRHIILILPLMSCLILGMPSVTLRFPTHTASVYSDTRSRLDYTKGSQLRYLSVC